MSGEGTLRALDLFVVLKGTLRDSLGDDSCWQQVRRQSSGFSYDLRAESIKIHYEGSSMLKSLLTFTFCSAVYIHSRLIKTLLSQIEG